jgi:hypothetical protein
MDVCFGLEDNQCSLIFLEDSSYHLLVLCGFILEEGLYDSELDSVTDKQLKQNLVRVAYYDF